MNRRLKYLHLKYDPGTRPFLDIVETVLKRAGSQWETDLTQRILSAVNEAGLSLMPVRCRFSRKITRKISGKMTILQMDRQAV